MTNWRAYPKQGIRKFKSLHSNRSYSEASSATEPGDDGDLARPTAKVLNTKVPGRGAVRLRSLPFSDGHKRLVIPPWQRVVY